MRAALCLLLIPLLSLSGCQREGGDVEVLRLANWGGAGDDGEFDRLVRQIYRDFERENPGVKIRVEGIPGGEYVSKMVLSYIAGTEPDIITLDASSSAIFINNDLLTDLKPFIEKDNEFKLDDYFENVVDIGRRGEKIYHIPNDFTPMVLYYNKRLFDRAGVPYPKPGWTFEEFRETARKLTIPGDGPGQPAKQYGWVFANWTPGWIMWLWNSGGDVLSPDGKHATGYLNSPQNVEAVKFIKSVIDDGSAPTLSQTAAQGVDLFANGQAAMTVSGHWAIIGYKNAPKDEKGRPRILAEELGVVSLPHNTPEPHTVMYESGYAIGKNSKKKELAWKFIKYFTSYRVQKKYNSSGIAVCARKDVAKERATEELEKQFLPIIPSARAPWGTRVEGYEYVEARAQDAMASVITNGKPVEQALTEAAERIDREFAKK